MAGITIEEYVLLKYLYGISPLLPPLDLRPIPHAVATQNRPFHPLSTAATPLALFSSQPNHHSTVPAHRFIRTINPREALIFISGRCLGNGTAFARAGYGIRWGPNSARSAMSYRLEGPGPQTSNRAELRAAIVALGGLRHWPAEGFATVVLACDTEYVVNGVCDWTRKWRQNRWKTSKGTEVANRDLWEELIGHLEGWDRKGLQVRFWSIPRSENREANALAKEGAEKLEEVEMMGILHVERPPCKLEHM
ncbi:MAG: hypothetical protein LQ346_002883 [Caloplaca aetnensis]|nr:MAG: hypothetical protein LQ346_002883 [Caloplaca aetnensis]